MPTINTYALARKVLTRLDWLRFRLRDSITDYHARAQGNGPEGSNETAETLRARVVADAARYVTLYQNLQTLADTPARRARLVDGLPTGITLTDIANDFGAQRTVLTTFRDSSMTTLAEIITACDTALSSLPANDEIE